MYVDYLPIYGEPTWFCYATGTVTRDEFNGLAGDLYLSNLNFSALVALPPTAGPGLAFGIEVIAGTRSELGSPSNSGIYSPGGARCF
jgi:hypothetical protein